MSELQDLSLFKYEVHVREASNLVSADFLGKSDPYCIVKMGGDVEQRTQIINQELNPKWNKSFVFWTHELQHFQFELRDWDQAGVHDFLGNADVSRSMLESMVEQHGAFKGVLDLQGVKSGKVDVEIILRVFPYEKVCKNLKHEEEKTTALTQELTGLNQKLSELDNRHSDLMRKHQQLQEAKEKEVKEVKVESVPAPESPGPQGAYREMYRYEVEIVRAWNITALGLNGLSDPFVQVYMESFGEALSKFTEVVPNTLSPYFRKKFVFASDIPEKFIFNVIDLGFLGIKRPLGQVEYDTKHMIEDQKSSDRQVLTLAIVPQGMMEINFSYFRMSTME